jgi:hypothetical protein
MEQTRKFPVALMGNYAEIAAFCIVNVESVGVAVRLRGDEPWLERLLSISLGGTS